MSNTRYRLPEKQKKTKSITLRMNESMHDRLQRKSDAKNQPLSETITDILDKGLKRNSKHEKELAAFLIEAQQMANDYGRGLDDNEKEQFELLMKGVLKIWDRLL